MTYKSPTGGYKPLAAYKPGKRRKANASRHPVPKPRPQCGQGIVNGDERYCPGCGRTWPKNEEHP